MSKLILLDRDGVINVDSAAYIKDAGEWRPIPGSLEAIAMLKRAGWLVGVCTNQSGVGRGLLSEAALARIHARLDAALAHRGAAVDALVYCPHRPDAGCMCRKPRPAMLRAVMARLGVPATRTLFVGDSLKDLRAAAHAGCSSVLVRTGSGAGAEPRARLLGVAAVVDDLASLARGLTGGRPC